tara:strand:+ start:298 stop:1380 length:1083 start_codon:yes stop_codon:yes gene_type:complete
MPKNPYPGERGRVINSKIFKTEVKFVDFIRNLKLKEMAKPLSQGTLDETKRDSMIHEYKTKPYLFALKNTIIIAVFNSNYYIVDGQHRISMAQELYNNNNNINDYFVCIWNDVQSEDEMRELFNSINIDAHHNNMYVSQDVFNQARIDRFTQFFKKEWKFPRSYNETRKVYTLEKVRDKLIENNFFNYEEHHNLNIYTDMAPNENYIDYICRSNDEFYEKCYRNIRTEYFQNLYYSHEVDYINDKRIMLLEHTNFFDWLKNKETVKPFHKARRLPKKNIPKPVRTQVWRNEFEDETTGKCPFFAQCNTILNNSISNGWHCGHIISDVNGGGIEASNLRPICASCNCSMGPRNWNEYEQLL